MQPTPRPIAYIPQAFPYPPSNLPYTLSVPLVLGTSPSLPATLLVACLTATASALNALSAL